jgi:hypothetical protein
LELFAEGAESATFVAEVVSIEALAPGDPARFDVALELVDVAPEALPLLMSVLGPETSRS